MPYKEWPELNIQCLDLSGRWLRIQNSKRNLSVVYVGGILGRIQDSSYGVSGSVGALTEDTKLEEICLWCKWVVSWAGYMMVHSALLDLSGRCLSIQNTKRNLNVVYVGSILGRIQDGAVWVSGSVGALAEFIKIEENFACGVNRNYFGQYKMAHRECLLAETVAP